MLSCVAKTVVTVMLAAGLWIPTARGQDHPTYQASIPFAFYVSDGLLPAGTYQITQPSPNILLLHNAQGVPMAYQLVFAKELAGSATTGKLTFSKYGDLYFLREFSAPNQNSGPHMASACLRGGIEKRSAKKFADASIQEMALNAFPQR